MAPVYWLIWLIMAVFASTAVGALAWAIGHGQMQRFAAGARSIFDAEEPLGEITDHFPGDQRRAP